jgi:hypothetical protein
MFGPGPAPRRPAPAPAPAPAPRPADDRMTRHEFLQGLHGVVEPRNYLEIGVNDGRSLALSRVPSIAVDPAFKVTVPLRCDLDLVKATSDDFFALPDPVAHFRRGGDRAASSPEPDGASGEQADPGVDLAFIDGMHLFEFALRDFMNVERHAAWWSVIVFDDMLPRDIDEAARDRHTVEWAGDVYKLIPVLARHRPDLTVIPVNTAPTGVLVVLAADPANTVLRDRYDEILAEWVVPDPQQVPQAILERAGAVEPGALLASPVWAEIVRTRRLELPGDEGRVAIRRSLGGATG